MTTMNGGNDSAAREKGFFGLMRESHDAARKAT